MPTTFVPMLITPTGTFEKEYEFYKAAFGAVENRRWSNDDGSVHVMEMSIGGALIHFHEESTRTSRRNPKQCNGVTATIGLMVENVDEIMASAIHAGAKEISPAQDYDYGYRQGEFSDPMGHQWIIEKKL